MRSSCRRLLATGALYTLLAIPALPASAADTALSEFAIVREETVVDGDLYAAGIRVVVDGVVEGDLIAVAGEEVSISGTVTGSVLAIAPAVTVRGEVGGSLRVVGGRLELEGMVRGDVVEATVSTALGAGSTIHGEVLAWTSQMSALGHIGIDLAGSVGDLELAGDIGRDVDVSVSRLTVVGSLRVGGDLGYRSHREGSGLSAAEVGGVTVQETPLAQNIRVRALALLARVLVVIFLTVSAITVVLSWPEKTKAAVEQLGTKPGRSWLLGLGVFLIPVLLTGIVALVVAWAPTTAALPFLVVMVPLILAIAGILLILGLVAGVPAVAWIGSQVKKGSPLTTAVVAGSGTAAVVWFLPAVGWLVPILLVPLGMGSWILSLRSEPG